MRQLYGLFVKMEEETKDNDEVVRPKSKTVEKKQSLKT